MAHVLLAMALALPAATGVADGANEQLLRLSVLTTTPSVEVFQVVSDAVGRVGDLPSFRMVVFDGMTLRSVCKAPCGTLVDGPRAEFFIAGDDVVPSDPFTLMGSTGELTLKVSAGSRTWRRAGKIMAGVGLVALAGSLVAAVVARPESPTARGMLEAGMVLGPVLGLAGLVVVKLNGTSVEFLPSKPNVQ
jgi:hypothetical protein